MMIKDLGPAVVSVWEGLRPITKKMLAGALRSEGSSTYGPTSTKSHYDAHADWEVSSLLTALDERSMDSVISNDAKTLDEISELAEICVRLLEEQTGSAEVFIQLAERALKQQDYEKLDKLSDRLFQRFSASEIAEVVRQSETPQIRAIAFEALSMLPVPTIARLLNDTLYIDIAAISLEQKAFEFDSEEARDVLDQLDLHPGSMPGQS